MIPFLIECVPPVEREYSTFIETIGAIIVLGPPIVLFLVVVVWLVVLQRRGWR